MPEAPVNLNRRRQGSLPVWVWAILGGIVALVVVSRVVAMVFTDYLWFDSIDATKVFQERLGVQVMLSLVFGVIFFLLAYGNLTLAERFAPQVRTVSLADDFLERYRELVEPRQRLIRASVSIGFAVVAGLGASGQWTNWLLFRYGGDVGTADPLFDADVGFFMFKLPFLGFVLSWAVASVVIVGLAVVLTYYVNGALRFPGTGPVATRAVKAHLSGLLAALALLKAIDYWLARYRTTASTRGVVDGALYADVKAAIPALTLLTLISVSAVVLLAFNLSRRGWRLPLIAVSMWLVISIVAGGIYPWFVQRFQVEPNPTALEETYLGDNIEATRAAFGLDNVEEENFDYTERPSDAAIAENQGTIENIRLLDPIVVRDTYAALESKFDFYAFNDLDVDRYEIDGRATQVVLGTRDLSPGGVPRKTWESQHLAYTHGYGVAMAPANAVNKDGEPDFNVGDVPWRTIGSRESSITLERPEIYVGEDMDTGGIDYSIVGTKVTELSGAGDAPPYSGDGGVGIGSLGRKAAFALRFGRIDPLITNNLTSDSRIFYVRDVGERVRAALPFVSWDSDPYPVLINGGISYVVDGYTTSDRYPYAQRAITDGLPANSDLFNLSFNYIRNSVKAVVNAYDGSVEFFLSDTLYGDEDPIIRAYAAALPGVFSDIDELGAEALSHLRYPEDLFRIQTAMWGRYHIDDPVGFYQQDDGWDVAQKPPQSITTTATSSSSSVDRIDPYYLQMRLPGESGEEFLIFRPFVQHSEPGSATPKKLLSSFMVGRSDPGEYGTLKVYTMSKIAEDGERERNREVLGPLNVHEKIVSDTESGATQEITLLNSKGGGSEVDFGNMLIIPIDQGLLYVRPLYLKGDSKGSPPRLRNVIVSLGEDVAIGNSLRDALVKLLPTATFETLEAGPGSDPESDDESTPDPADPQSTEDTTPDAEPSRSAEELVAAAIVLFDQADEALKEGGIEGFTEYQAKLAAGRELLGQAEELLSAA